MADVKVLALVGSLRAASINRQLAELAAETAPDGVTVTVFEGLGDLPFYNEDIDNENVPASVVALREAAADADAALVVTPEYNGSIPGVLKNAIDWLSRPFGNGALKGKPRPSSAGRSASTAACGRTTRPASRSGSRARVLSRTSSCRCRFKSLDGKHPRENAEVAANLRDIVGKLAAEVG